MPKRLTDHDLLIRIDERQATIVKKITGLCDSLDKKVNDDSEYKNIVKQHKSLWDYKNKMTGWMLGAGAVGGTVVSIIRGLVEEVFAR